MKLRKFFGLTSRSVLEQVRCELGADAVIVANHATPDGVEVTALAGDAIDTLLGQVNGPSQRPQPGTARPALGRSTRGRPPAARRRPAPRAGPSRP